MDRRTLGSWLQGPGALGSTAPEAGASPRADAGGLPLAGVGRRLVALAVDWVLCLLIATGFLRGVGDPAGVTLAVFALENVVLVGTLGSTVGMRLLGIGVRRLDGAVPGWGAAAVRTLLLCLVVPAVIWDAQGRGLHDKAARTLPVRL